MKKMKRRDFLKIGVTAAPLALPWALNLGCSTNALKRTPAGENGGEADRRDEAKLRIRYEISSKEAKKHLESYAKAIEKMRAQPETVANAVNGLRWAAQADIHNDHCPHGTWNFFPWHREYLMRFEDIIREMSGDAEFALPYWDWSSNPDFPVPFKNIAALAETGAKSDTSRAADMAAQIKGIANPDVCTKAIDTKDFESFMGSEDSSGQVEYGPHNGVHVIVGSFGSPMGAFRSPLDPIFWTHHCNVDRLWAEWQDKHPEWRNEGTIRENKFDKWLGQKLEGFYDTQGKALTEFRTSTDVLDTYKLGYAYPTTAARKNAAGRSPAAASRTRLKVRAFNRDPIQAKTTVGADHTAVDVVFPDFKNTAGVYLDDYVKHLAHEEVRLVTPGGETVNFDNLIFRLKVMNMPKITGGAILRISFAVPKKSGQAFDPVFLTHYNFFVGSNGASHHGHHGGDFVPNFNLDYTPLLADLQKKGFGDYPADTKLVLKFYRPNGKKFALSRERIQEIEYKIVVLERVPGSER